MTKEIDNTYSEETTKILKNILGLNVFVLIMKFVVGFYSGSLAIISDAVHSTTDSLNNVVGIAVLKHSNQPPDKDHPYGHGKFETLAAFAIVVFLAIAFFEIVKSAIERLVTPIELPVFSSVVVITLVVTLLINIFVWQYERRKGLELNSDLLLADSSHTGSDILITLSVLFPQLFIAKGLLIVDPIVAFIIAALIAKAAREIILNTVPILVDEVWLKEEDIKKLF